MGDKAVWEERFVRAYIAKTRQNRYLTFLKGKKRQHILNRLNHSLDLDDRKAEVLDKRHRSASALTGLLRDQRVADTCFLIADGSEYDGCELPLDQGVDALLNNFFGAVLICPPKPIALYKTEDLGTFMILGRG